MWKELTIMLILIGVVVFFLTEIIIPIFMDKPLFGSFRRKKKVVASSDLEKKVDETKEKFCGLKEESASVKAEVEAEIERVEGIKNKTNDLP